MKTFISISVLIAGIVSGMFSGIFGDFFSGIEWVELLCGGSGITLALALGTVMYSDLPEEIRSVIRRWHGTMDEQFNNISNVLNRLKQHSTEWEVPEAFIKQLSSSHDQLSALIIKCKSSDGSSSDRALRNSLLKTTVGLCLTRVKSWAFAQYYEGVLTATDVHLLGFLLPGETGGQHNRKLATNVLAEVKVLVINMDYIRIIIDQAGTENAALVKHGWPYGVRQALIVILAADGVTEVYRQMTTRLHTDIEMPAGSRGKQFIVKAAFLQHVDDKPKFGNEPAFSMPLTTEDLAASLDRQHHEEYEEHLREVERHRQEIERLEANMKTDETKA
jgi:hypothetical protein